jgi:Carboxypeptidase regulatory-like domain
MNRFLAAVTTAFTICLAPAARAQDTTAGGGGRLVGRVLFQETATGVPYATVTLNPPNGMSRFADTTGAFAFPNIQPGTYRVRARQIGFTPFDTTVQVLPGPAITTITLRLRHVARLAEIKVRAKAPKECTNPGVPDSTVDPALALMFSQMNENIVRMRILMTDYPFRYRRIDEFIDREPGEIDHRSNVDTLDLESWSQENYVPGEVITNGFDQHGRPGQFMHLVQFQDLTERSFEDNHCFHLVDDESGLTRIDFRPKATMEFPDIEGSVYLDPEKMIVRHATFHLTRPHMARPPIRDWTYESTFNEVVPLVPFVQRFHSVVAPARPMIQIEDGRVTDYDFIREAPVDPTVHDTLAGAGTPSAKTIVGQVHFGADETQTCSPPPPQLIVEQLTGTILATPDSEANASWRTAARALLKSVQARLSIPSTLDLTTFGYAAPASAEDAAGRGALRVAPGIFGRYAVDLHRLGAQQDVRVSATSLSSDVDSAVVLALRGTVSDRLRGETVVLSVSTAAPPADTSLSISFAHVQVPSWLQTRAAALTTPAATAASRPAPGDTAAFEFIIDSQGKAVLSTVHRVGWPNEMDPLTEAAEDSLSSRTYRPALVGRCPISQVATQRFIFQRDKT